MDDNETLRVTIANDHAKVRGQNRKIEIFARHQPELAREMEGWGESGIPFVPSRAKQFRGHFKSTLKTRPIIGGFVQVNVASNAKLQ
jgi:hypothetical protein